ncbi:MAG: hypothetical protein NC417_14455 [Candidatus Gastranaerophilales bacterium]|nr:hypothetical protein [Candidatus Gastranaerophilales bacterium]
MTVQGAKGASIRREDLSGKKEYLITDFGAASGGDPVHNTRIINETVEKAAALGGGTVVIPEGEFKVYTIVLKSHVNLKIDRGAVLRAARTDIRNSYEKQQGEGGNYLEPEVNLYAGIQDHGHSYFANSLIYARDQRDIMVCGEGLIDGSYVDEETGYLHYTLMGGDPVDGPLRNESGHAGEWFGNKGIAFVCCENVVLADFSLVIGGHFAVIAEGVRNLRAEHILVDTTRDAFDIDCCEDVTVVHSRFNSLTDDALVVKASFGAGKYLPSRNILIEDCVVSGYDAGSVYAGVNSANKLVATDCCGPTGRVKLGTESTCGYERVTIRRVAFERSRGFALEAVDGSDLKDILFEDCTMDNVSSSPIFIRAGDRGRFPVTGNSKEHLLEAADGNVRLDDRKWVLPDAPEYDKYPPKRYIPSYCKDRQVSVDGHSSFSIVNEQAPARINPANLQDEEMRGEREKYYRANACGSERMAKVSNIVIRNVTVTDADPRYPILIMGLVDSPVENVLIENVSVTYRGGMKMEHAIEQRQLNTNWEYAQYETESKVQTVPWLVNPFFLKEEGLLPRVDWDRESGSWRADPYNVPEMPRVYPEPSNWGILPAYGVYVRHMKNLELKNVQLLTETPDERHGVVLDDVDGVILTDVSFSDRCVNAPLVTVENRCRRHTNREYVPEEPYFTTRVSGLSTDLDAECVVVDAPAPGTPSDALYPYPTVAIPENGYQFTVPTEQYPLPLTVYIPCFAAMTPVRVRKGTILNVPVRLNDPAAQATEKEAETFIYNEEKKQKPFVRTGSFRNCPVRLESDLPGASFCEDLFSWDTAQAQEGRYQVIFSADAGFRTVYGRLEVEIVPADL